MTTNNSTKLQGYAKAFTEYMIKEHPNMQAHTHSQRSAINRLGAAFKAGWLAKQEENIL